MIEHQNSYDSKCDQQELQDDINGFELDSNEKLDNYEKRDRLS